MTKSLYVFPLLLLPLCLVTACASTDPQANFEADDCRALNALMRDRNENVSVIASPSQIGSAQDNAKDQFTVPWGRGGTNQDKVSKERASLRKAHRRKGCAQ